MMCRVQLWILSLFSILSINAEMQKGPSLESKLAIELLEATHHNGSSTRVVSDPAKAMLVEEIVYFWGDKYLPQSAEKECFTLQTSNGRGNVTICDLPKLQKCSNPVDDIVSLFEDKITFDNGTRPTQLVWLCPQNNVCGKLKCCDSSASPYEAVIACGFVALLVILIFCFWRMTVLEARGQWCGIK